MGAAKAKARKKSGSRGTKKAPPKDFFACAAKTHAKAGRVRFIDPLLAEDSVRSAVAAAQRLLRHEQYLDSLATLGREQPLPQDVGDTVARSAKPAKGK